MERLVDCKLFYEDYDKLAEEKNILLEKKQTAIAKNIADLEIIKSGLSLSNEIVQTITEKIVQEKEEEFSTKNIDEEMKKFEKYFLIVEDETSAEEEITEEESIIEEDKPTFSI